MNIYIHRQSNKALLRKAKRLKEKINDQEKYYEIIVQVEKCGEGVLAGDAGSPKGFEGKNGICEEKQIPQIYKRSFNKSCKGTVFKKTTLKLDEAFDDVIVGWNVSSCWHDGTNGTWKLEFNPLLNKQIRAEFVSKAFRGQSFWVHVYLIKYPS